MSRRRPCCPHVLAVLLEPAGEPQVSASWQPVREGDLVIVEVAREAANLFGVPQPFDSVILGRVDNVHIDQDAT